VTTEGGSKYVAVTGAVGAGATTLATLITQYWDADTLLEGQIEVLNPFFDDAQRDPVRWTFASQAHFLAASARRHQDLRTRLSQTRKALVIEDRTPFEHTSAYVEASRALGHITQRELILLRDLAHEIERTYIVPDVLIYREMTDNQLVERVKSRGRAGESADFHKLKTILEAFGSFVSNWSHSPVLRIGHDLDLYTPQGRSQTIALLSTHLGPPGK